MIFVRMFVCELKSGMMKKKAIRLKSSVHFTSCNKQQRMLVGQPNNWSKRSMNTKKVVRSMFLLTNKDCFKDRNQNRTKIHKQALGLPLEASYHQPQMRLVREQKLLFHKDTEHQTFMRIKMQSGGYQISQIKIPVHPEELRPFKHKTNNCKAILSVYMEVHQSCLLLYPQDL